MCERARCDEQRAFFFIPSPLAGDDCMDAGGRTTPGAVVEGRVRVSILPEAMLEGFVATDYVAPTQY